jgi:hypothetical protein
VVEHSTYNPKIKGSNHATGTWRKKVANACLIRGFKKSLQWIRIKLFDESDTLSTHLKRFRDNVLSHVG